MARILIVEDEDRIASFVEQGLRAHGYATTTVGDGRTGLAEASGGHYDLVILDVGLPILDGFDVLARLRRSGVRTPVIMLTARDSVDDRVRGLGGGADDYLVKPFAFDELLARLQLRLRPPDDVLSSQITVGDLTLDLRTRRIITASGRELELSAREFSLAEVFFTHPEQVLSREQLLSRVWDLDFDPGSNVVNVYVRYLRKKIGAHRIETVRGMGYRFTG